MFNSRRAGRWHRDCLFVSVGQKTKAQNGREKLRGKYGAKRFGLKNLTNQVPEAE